MSSDNKTTSIRTLMVRLLHWSVIVLCLTYAFWDLNVEFFLSSFASYSLPSLILAAGLTFTSYFTQAARLGALAQGRVAYTDNVVGTIIGQGVNNILPAKLGEAVKAYYLARESGQTVSWLIGLVFWERFFDLNLLLLLGLAIVLSVSSPLSMGAFGLLVLGVWLLLLVIRRWPQLARSLTVRLPVQSVREFCLELIEHLVVGLNLKVVLVSSFWSVLIWLQYVGQVALVLILAAGLELDLTAVLVIFVVSGVGMNLAGSPGGLGVYEAAVVLSAGWFGVGQEQALAAAIVLHVIQYMPSTVLGLLLMSRFNVSYKQIGKPAS